MSDYYGEALLEDWLAEEVFHIPFVSKKMVNHFEKWREGIENSIEGWMDSDDGDGNHLSWRDWGRGFYGIPDEDEKEFEEAVTKGRVEIERMKEHFLLEERILKKREKNK